MDSSREPLAAFGRFLLDRQPLQWPRRHHSALPLDGCSMTVRVRRPLISLSPAFSTTWSRNTLWPCCRKTSYRFSTYGRISVRFVVKGHTGWGAPCSYRAPPCEVRTFRRSSGGRGPRSEEH